MRIGNLIIMRSKTYDDEIEKLKKEQKKEIERIKTNHAAYVGTLAEQNQNKFLNLKELAKKAE